MQIDDKDPTRKSQIKTKLTLMEKEELIAFLLTNKDVLAWTSTNMPMIPTSVTMQNLSTNPLKNPIT